jgi:hypothetical protein
VEKISRILPSSPRITSTDIKDAHPVRPGTPTFGVPEGNSTGSGINRSALDANLIAHDHLDWRSKDQKNAAIAQTVSKSFFMKNAGEAEGPDQVKASGNKVAEQVADHAESSWLTHTPAASATWSPRSLEKTKQADAEESAPINRSREFAEDLGDENEEIEGASYSPTGNTEKSSHPKGSQVSIRV